VNLSSLLQDQNSLAEAEPIFRQALAGLEEELGPSHQFTLVSIDNLATLLLGAGRLQEAKELYERAIREAEVVLSPTDPQTLTSVNNLAALLQEQKKFKESQTDFEKAYTLPDGQVVTLGKERFKVPEVLFDPMMMGKELPGLHRQCHNCVITGAYRAYFLESSSP